MPACLIAKLSPALKVTVSPALISSAVVPVTVPVPALPDVAVHAALFTALATVSTVAILPASLSFTFTVPGVVPGSAPVLTGSISPVTTFNPSVLSVVIVLPSVLTFKPLFVTSKDLSAVLTIKPSSVVFNDLSPRLTFTPSLFASKDLSAALTAILLLASFSKPSPRFTLYFTVDVLPSVLSTVAVVPSPLIKFTVSYGFTKSTAALLPCRFQPAFNTSPTVAAFVGFT